MKTDWLRFESLVWRRAIAGFAIAAYFASVWGFPLPAGGPQDRAVAFPCQAHGCGCQSAEECWNGCCCFTPAERLAWARAHRVHIPGRAREALLAAAETASRGASCCASTAGEHVAACGACDAGEDSPGVKWVLGLSARKCAGLATLWIASGAAIPWSAAPAWEFDWTPVERVAVSSDAWTSLATAPAVPPPRAASTLFFAT